MMVSKTYLLSNMAIFGIHVSFRGCAQYKHCQTLTSYHPFPISPLQKMLQTNSQTSNHKDALWCLEKVPQKYSPLMAVNDSDESHGIESVKDHQTNESQQFKLSKLQAFHNYNTIRQKLHKWRPSVVAVPPRWRYPHREGHMLGEYESDPTCCHPQLSQPSNKKMTPQKT